MYRIRLWATRHAKAMETTYNTLERTLLALAPIMERIGYQRFEKPVAVFEKAVKGVLFDCQMCGQCALSKTGMSCPMNCPKSLRNGPCGGVRRDGFCEVKPEMRCVWVEGYAGSKLMNKGDTIKVVQFAVDHRLKGSSSWLREIQQIRQKQQTNTTSAEGTSS